MNTVSAMTNDLNIPALRPRVMVLSGPEGSGKFSTAFHLALLSGWPRVIDQGDLEDKFQEWMWGWPRTVIVDEPHNIDWCLTKLKDLTAHETMRVSRLLMRLTIMNTPKFIVCTSGQVPAKYLNDPCLHVVAMPL